MEIKIHGDKIKVTPSIKAYIEEKLAKLDKYFDSPEEITATARIRVRNNDQIIEVTIPAQKFALRAEEKHTDLYASIDLVVDKLEGQIRKHKTRLHDKYKKEPSIIDFILDFEYDKNEENENKIVKRKTIESKPMDEEEAILQMELLNHDFFIFNNIDEECTSVLYKRKDGHYGIINTK